MNKIAKMGGAAIALAVLMGCAITQNVRPVSGSTSSDICVINNTEVVQDGFHPTLVQVLTRKGFVVKTLPFKSAIDACPLLISYEALYRWDMAIYLARLDVQVYGEGKEVGRVNYDSLTGGLNMNKFIRTEAKLIEVVSELFPGKKCRQQIDLSGLVASRLSAFC